MELLLDTDFIIKMSRYDLLEAFESVVASRHSKPYRILYEIRTIEKSATPPRFGLLGDAVAKSRCWGFISNCTNLPAASNINIIRDLTAIPEIDSGEALLLEYAIQNPYTCIITGDKRSVGGLCYPALEVYRQALKGRMICLERVIWSIKQAIGFAEVRARIAAQPSCDSGLTNAIDARHKDAEAEGNIFKILRDHEGRSRGLLCQIA